MRPHTQELVIALIDVAGRREAARALARHLCSDDLIVFVVDSEVGASLPALGFPQTLPRGRSWRAFLRLCATTGKHTGELAFPDARTNVLATAVAAEDGTVLVLLGGAPRLDEAEEVRLQLPLLGAAFRGERLASTAASHARAAREAAAQANALAERLDATRSRLQRALVMEETATRAKDEFLATVSHELRTPLNAILGWSRLLRTGQLDESTVPRALETIERNARAQAHLIEDILDFSRIISGKLRLDVCPVELVAVIQAAIDVVRPAADAKGVRLQVVLDPRAGPVSGDPNRLQQVFWNLLSNAIKFTSRGGRVHIRLERIDSQVEVTVTDTGQGIRAEFLPHLFERFRQADNTSTRSDGGLGLGLAITRHLLELHGGSIHGHSDGEGRGATFTVRLPLMIMSPSMRPSAIEGDQQQLAHEHDVRFSNLPRLDGLDVLVVDNEADARELLTAILTQYGASVTAVATVSEALDLLLLRKPDLVVSDIGMPGEDGYVLIRRLRAFEEGQGRQIPAIALTAHAKASDRIRALSAGYQVHVPKPVEPAELVVTIANLANRTSRA